jgi:hypothetical protein
MDRLLWGLEWSDLVYGLKNVSISYMEWVKSRSMGWVSLMDRLLWGLEWGDLVYGLKNVTISYTEWGSLDEWDG